MCWRVILAEVWVESQRVSPRAAASKLSIYIQNKKQKKNRNQRKRAGSHLWVRYLHFYLAQLYKLSLKMILSFSPTKQPNIFII